MEYFLESHMNEHEAHNWHASTAGTGTEGFSGAFSSTFNEGEGYQATAIHSAFPHGQTLSVL